MRSKYNQVNWKWPGREMSNKCCNCNACDTSTKFQVVRKLVLVVIIERKRTECPNANTNDIEYSVLNEYVSFT